MVATKKIITFLGLVGVAGLLGFTYAQKEKAEKVLDEIKLKIRGIDKIRYDFTTLSFRVKLSLKNRTAYHFSSLDGLTVKKLRIYDTQHNLLADANINAENIIFPPNGEYLLPPTQLVINMGSLGNFLLQNKDSWNKPKNLAKLLIYEVDIMALGYEQTITID